MQDEPNLKYCLPNEGKCPHVLCHGQVCGLGEDVTTDKSMYRNPVRNA